VPQIGGHVQGAKIIAAKINLAEYGFFAAQLGMNNRPLRFNEWGRECDRRR